MTTSPDHEQRIETRVDTETTIFLERLNAGRTQDNAVIMCTSLDISANGLQVLVDEEIAAGSILRLCVDLKDDEPIFLVGEVMWKRFDTDADAWRLGFLLFEADGSDIQRWKETIATLLAS